MLLPGRCRCRRKSNRARTMTAVLVCRLSFCSRHEVPLSSCGPSRPQTDVRAPSKKCSTLPIRSDDRKHRFCHESRNFLSPRERVAIETRHRVPFCPSSGDRLGQDGSSSEVRAVCLPIRNGARVGPADVRIGRVMRPLHIETVATTVRPRTSLHLTSFLVRLEEWPRRGERNLATQATIEVYEA